MPDLGDGAACGGGVLVLRGCPGGVGVMRRGLFRIAAGCVAGVMWAVGFCLLDRDMPPEPEDVL